jgi:hypothetical protein
VSAKVRPILFTGPMVRGLLREAAQPGTGKRQTRRLLKTGPRCPPECLRHVPCGICGLGRDYAPGDLLWVRESWRTLHKNDCLAPRNLAPDISKITYEADPERRNPLWAFGKLRPGIFLPRWASRLTLEVIDVKVERLQDISEEDAIAEGVEFETADPPFWYVPDIWPHSITAVGVEEREGRRAERCYGKLWDHINGFGSWDANAWIVAVTFRAHYANVDAMLRTSEAA